MANTQARSENGFKQAAMDTFKWLIFPGINLHARERFRRVPEHLHAALVRDRVVLDAGFGNGMLSWQAWRRGYRVVGVTLKESEVSGATRLFNDRLGISRDELCFVKHNLYDTDGLRARYGQFDEIVCADVIEHIVDHQRICTAFWDLLKPGGALHLTTPNATHPYNASFPLDLNEGGGHVRPGYTLDSFKQLLEPIGFQVEEFYGFGGRIRQWFNRVTKESQERYGAWAGVPFFLIALPFLPFDSKNPKEPFSYYLRVRKPSSRH